MHVGFTISLLHFPKSHLHALGEPLKVASEIVAQSLIMPSWSPLTMTACVTSSSVGHQKRSRSCRGREAFLEGSLALPCFPGQGGETFHQG